MPDPKKGGSITEPGDTVRFSLDLAQRIAGHYAALSEVVAVGLGGSLAGGAGDTQSDIDLYVFTKISIPDRARLELARQAGAGHSNLLLQFWDAGEEWYDAASRIEVDVIYWDTGWIEAQIARVWEEHQPALGYTTSFVHTLAGMQPLYDPAGWLAARKDRCAGPYPAALRTAILRRNYPVLRRAIPSYLHQLEKASRRVDLVSANHRTAALLASYFDLLFALNHRLHPGEKRLLELARKLPKTPEGMAEDVPALLRASGSGGPEVVEAANRLVDRLDDLLRAEGIEPEGLIDYVESANLRE